MFRLVRVAVVEAASHRDGIDGRVGPKYQRATIARGSTVHPMGRPVFAGLQLKALLLADELRTAISVTDMLHWLVWPRRMSQM